MKSGIVRDIYVIEKFNSGWTYLEIAQSLRTTRNAIAGVCRRLGLVRGTGARGPRMPKPPKPPAPPVISQPEQAERAMDRRDLDALMDIDEGHSLSATAKHWGISRSLLRALQKHSQAAA